MGIWKTRNPQALEFALDNIVPVKLGNNAAKYYSSHEVKTDLLYTDKYMSWRIKWNTDNQHIGVQ